MATGFLTDCVSTVLYGLRIQTPHLLKATSSRSFKRWSPLMTSSPADVVHSCAVKGFNPMVDCTLFPSPLFSCGLSA
ncbi:hypothetical protein GN956_G11945 [Arapaima gigas]